MRFLFGASPRAAPYSHRELCKNAGAHLGRTRTACGGRGGRGGRGGVVYEFAGQHNPPQQHEWERGAGRRDRPHRQVRVETAAAAARSHPRLPDAPRSGAGAQGAASRGSAVTRRGPASQLGSETRAWDWPRGSAEPVPLPGAPSGSGGRWVAARLGVADGPAPLARARCAPPGPHRRAQVPGAGPVHRLEGHPEDHPERRAQDRHVPERRLGPPGRRGRALPVQVQ